MKFLSGVVTTLVLLAAGVLAVIWSGAYDVAATDRHADPVYWALDTTMRNSVAHRAHEPAPGSFTEEQVRAGFSSFDAMCVQCHGAPGVDPDEWAVGLRPNPPMLPGEVSEWTTEELFWIVKHGIKMSGMPALAPSHDDEQIWEIVAFLEQLPGIDSGSYARLRETVSAGHHRGSGSGGHDGSDDGHAAAEGNGAEAGHHEGSDHDHGAAAEDQGGGTETQDGGAAE